jgi:tetraacyldisaccharide 4'-kinase
VYRIGQLLAFPLLLVYFARRSVQDRRYRRGLAERFGILPRSFRQTVPGALWLHAVSVGEVLSSIELIRRLRSELPLAPVFLSTTTLAGRAVAEDKLRGLADGVFFAPVDYCAAIRRVLRLLKPRVLVVLETEIWPNLWREAARAGCAVVVVNARISDRALPRYRRVRWFLREVLPLAGTIHAQTEVSAERYRELGGTAEAAGNLKYDFAPSAAGAPAAIREVVARLRPSEIWIAASTMPPARPEDPDEDDVVIDGFRALAARRPGLLLILAPRRPERFEEAAERLWRAGVPFVRRSDPGDGSGRVLLLDSIGELNSLFELADVVFMGGTLASRGGHNILEPAFFGKPVIVGPHMQNFPEIARKFTDAGAVVSIGSAAELAGAVEALLDDPARRKMIGDRALALAGSERGATARAVNEIVRRYGAALPVFWPAAWPVLWPLSRLWRAASAVKRRLDLNRRVRLGTPVISVGGLAAGGSGKTPLVLWLAERLRERGLRPAILTRGYRRRAAERCTIIAPEEPAPVERTGDEAQAYLGLAPLGIAADRAAAGRQIEERFHPDVFLLDDGFQHHRLERALDIVVIDALEPFGEPLPLGRFRETAPALRRAGAVVITRASGSTAAIEAGVRRHNPHAPVFVSRVTPRGWSPALPPGKLAAFCGLGNPHTFWLTLAELGIRPAFRRAFPDHHRYTHQELEQLAAEGEALVTTEKDFWNLPPRWQSRVHFLRIGVEIIRSEELTKLIVDIVGNRPSR